MPPEAAISTNEDLAQQIAALRSELNELQDKEAIRERLDRYVFLLDSAQWSKIPEEIFTEDGVDFHLPEADPPVIPRGRRQLLEFFESMMPNFVRTQHMLGNSRIEVGGDEAQSRTYAHIMLWNAGEPQGEPFEYVLAVAYDDRWRRTEKGWQIFERRLHGFGSSVIAAADRLPAAPRVGTDVFGSGNRQGS
jgi:hypothetical protein